MAFDAKKNFAASLVATAPSPAASGTSLVVMTGEGALFPAVPFNVTIWPVGVQPTTANAEIVRVTNITGDTLTITRAQESTSARTILAGDQISATITAKALTDVETAVIAAEAAAGAAVPVGTLAMWGATSAPPAPWVLLNGAAISRTTYSALFTLWGTLYGAGNGSTTFNVPDMRQRLPIGQATAGALATLGATAGSWDHTHGAGSFAAPTHVHSAGSLAAPSHTHGPGSLTVASHDHGPNTLTVASHTHGASAITVSTENLDHTHSMVGHTHSMQGHSHGFSGTTSGDSAPTNYGHASGDQLDVSAPGHTHGFSGTTDGPSAGDTGGPSSGDTGTMSHNPSHSHTLSGNTGSTGPAVNSGRTTAEAPGVNAGVTGGPSATAVTGSTGNNTTALGITGTSDAANPPVLVVNFMVKAA
jgi:microcystin-dependent protein